MLFIFMACVHNTASVGDSKVALKAGKILKIESKWKTYFGWRLFLDLLLFHLPEHSPAPPCLTPRSLRLLCE